MILSRRRCPLGRGQASTSAFIEPSTIGMAGWMLTVLFDLKDPPEIWVVTAAQDLGRLELSFWALVLFAVTIPVP